MPDRPKRPRDTNQLAKFIVDVATGECADSVATASVNETARAGGLKGGKVRRRASIARQTQRDRTQSRAGTMVQRAHIIATSY